MAAITGYKLTLDPMGKCSNAFFLETTNQTQSKLDRNVHWWWQPSWISDRHKNPREPSNDNSRVVWFKLSQVVSERKRFETLPNECSLDGSLQTLGFLFRYEIQNGVYGST
jgi:hypothetical protein